ncbi:MAG: flagellar hook-basal body protein [Lachnospiraceae bacterium]|jgi:flagellar basal-body rod protein FlgF|nr:flagellar hook-basal body protein [Lachnospiraceae bacterium]
MYQGFYNLVSGMLTQSRNLNVVSNNMVNVQTPGYKNDTMVSTTFQEEMLKRTGRWGDSDEADLIESSKIITASETYVDYTQGSFEATGGVYDFALSGNGFFCIQTNDGQTRYTRNGSFAVDNEGYLVLNDQGRVLGTNGQPIQIGNEEFLVDSKGRITSRSAYINGTLQGNTAEFGTLRVVDFVDYDQLHREDNGLFSTDQAALQASENTQVLWQSLEKSNVDMVEEMTSMMSSQRALQSAAQMLKMYDRIMEKSSVDIGRV